MQSFLAAARWTRIEERDAQGAITFLRHGRGLTHCKRDYPIFVTILKK